MNKLDLSEYVIRINRRQVDPTEASVSVFDHGFLFGDSIYEVVRTVNGKVFGWEEHIKRLRHSAERLSINLPWTDEELTDEIQATAAAGTWSGETYIRIFITRGIGRIELMPTTCESPNLIVVARELPDFPVEIYKNGIVLCLTEVRRNSRLAMDPGIKSGNYLNNVLAIIEANNKGADDAVMLNEHGHLTEATTSNFFMVSNGILKTPSLECGILAGITRDKLLEIAAAEGIPAEETELDIDDLKSADEIFISGTVKGVVPVRKVVGQVEWDGVPGPLTKRMMKAFCELTGLKMLVD